MPFCKYKLFSTYIYIVCNYKTHYHIEYASTNSCITYHKQVRICCNTTINLLQDDYYWFTSSFTLSRATLAILLGRDNKKIVLSYSTFFVGWYIFYFIQCVTTSSYIVVCNYELPYHVCYKNMNFCIIDNMVSTYTNNMSIAKYK